MTRQAGGLTESDVETLYETLAKAIDRAGPDKEAIFLAKLALLLAREIGDLDDVTRLVAVSLRDLD